jgi:hypothetical protein
LPKEKNAPKQLFILGKIYFKRKKNRRLRKRKYCPSPQCSDYIWPAAGGK